MGKVQMGPQTWIYPMPVLLIGTVVGGRPNFMAAAWCGIANGTPPMVSVAIRHGRYSGEGVKRSRAFSVNVPSEDLVKETDYCGIVSGAEADKAAVCGFGVFYSKSGSHFY